MTTATATTTTPAATTPPPDPLASANKAKSAADDRVTAARVLVEQSHAAVKTASDQAKACRETVAKASQAESGARAALNAATTPQEVDDNAKLLSDALTDVVTAKASLLVAETAEAKAQANRTKLLDRLRLAEKQAGELTALVASLDVAKESRATARGDLTNLADRRKAALAAAVAAGTPIPDLLAARKREMLTIPTRPENPPTDADDLRKKLLTWAEARRQALVSSRPTVVTTVPSPTTLDGCAAALTSAIAAARALMLAQTNEINQLKMASTPVEAPGFGLAPTRFETMIAALTAHATELEAADGSDPAPGLVTAVPTNVWQTIRRHLDLQGRLDALMSRDGSQELKALDDAESSLVTAAEAAAKAVASEQKTDADDVDFDTQTATFRLSAPFPMGLA